MSNAAALRPEGGKQSGETSAQRRRERPNPGRLPAKRRRFCAGRGRNTGPVAQKGRRPPPKIPQRPREKASPGEKTPSGSAPASGSAACPAQKAACRPPAPMG